jgi:hypothetical protein
MECVPQKARVSLRRLRRLETIDSVSLSAVYSDAEGTAADSKMCWYEL